MRIGQGFDVHRFCKGRPLILGGVTIPHHHGLEGHSDADVVIHAICDALLGAAALGDIGEFFPSTHDRWKGVDSRMLLRNIYELITERGFRIENVDATVMAQVPKLSPYREAMRLNVAEDLRVSIEQISIKATTTDGMGFVGRKEAIAAAAIVLITKNGNGS